MCSSDLTELPELVEIDEWMGMSAADERAYRAVVFADEYPRFLTHDVCLGVGMKRVITTNNF